MANETLSDLIRYLLSERPEINPAEIPDDEAVQFRLYRSLVNTRPAARADPTFLRKEDAFLQEQIAKKGITDLLDLEPVQNGIYLWKGDITTLKCDAIVNAANSGMTGCWYPCHNCIDNCIHTFSGVRLRSYCAQMMRKQGHEEPTGTAKITPAFNLPCRYILHTVGPVITEQVTNRDRELLASCYRSCLELAVKNDCHSIAFCCISTGEFRFPHDQAAEIAVRTVTAFRDSGDHDIRVVFNVFQDTDLRIYQKLLGVSTC